MKIHPVSFKGNLTKGKEEFNKLTETERIGKLAIEKFRQEYNKTNLHPLESPKGDMADYVRHRTYIENILSDSNKVKQMFANAIKKVTGKI